MNLKPIRVLGQLRFQAKTEPRYAQLAIAAANNLGGAVATLDAAMHWLNASASETDEAGVVEEVNFCIPLVK